LAKSDPVNWPSLLSAGETQSAGAGPSASSYIPTPAEERPKPKRKNWDTVVDEDDETNEKDPVSSLPKPSLIISEYGFANQPERRRRSRTPETILDDI
jgi:hypothetical protein